MWQPSQDRSLSPGRQAPWLENSPGQPGPTTTISVVILIPRCLPPLAISSLKCGGLKRCALPGFPDGLHPFSLIFSAGKSGGLSPDAGSACLECQKPHWHFLRLQESHAANINQLVMSLSTSAVLSITPRRVPKETSADEQASSYGGSIYSFGNT
jgi:hypothetical protein